MKYYYIYLITNKINGKQYIGQHYGELEDGYFGSGVLITKAIEKYGKENFSKEIIYIGDSRAELDFAEKDIIKECNAVEDENFYNLAEGGTKGDGWRAYQKWLENHPEEAKIIYQKSGQRLQQWRIDHPKEYYEKVIIPFIQGSKKWREEHPEEIKQNIAKCNIARDKWREENYEEWQEQIEEWRAKGSETNSKKIRCITTGEVFPSLSEAERQYYQYGVRQANLTKVIKGMRQSCGKKDGQKLKWELVT